MRVHGKEVHFSTPTGAINLGLSGIVIPSRRTFSGCDRN